MEPPKSSINGRVTDILNGILIIVLIGALLFTLNSFGVKLPFLNKVENDFYMLSDQDDIWLPNKLISAIENLNKLKSPVKLYCSNLYYYKNGENLDFIKTWADQVDARAEISASINQGISDFVGATLPARAAEYSFDTNEYDFIGFNFNNPNIFEEIIRLYLRKTKTFSVFIHKDKYRISAPPRTLSTQVRYYIVRYVNILEIHTFVIFRQI